MPSDNNGLNLGLAVQGYLPISGRAYETAVFQAGLPVLDKEINLVQFLGEGRTLDIARSTSSSGWVSDDALNLADPSSAIFVPSSTANTLLLSNNLKALVNGWLVLVANTNNSSGNQLTLPVGPTGNGARRTDLVILEVWRRLIGPTTATGKSPGGRIWANGNVKIAAGSDATLNYPDDSLDTVLGIESTKRVQIQYRLRVIPGVDLFAYPAGIDDPSVVANTVPASAAAPDGTATTFIYSNQSSSKDPGLWVAGDGTPSNSIGSIDGYIYAIPLCAIFRRNLSSFNKNLNHNGGAVNPGPSTRPDGLLSDIIASTDLADLRQCVSLTGWDYREVLERSLGALFDNNLKTEWTTTPIGGGSSGHTTLWADEIGTLPGDGVTTGDTPGAEFLGQFDSTRRFFSDRPNYEVLTFKLTPGDASISTATWQAGTQVTITPSLLAQWPFTSIISWLSRAPSGTRIIDVLRARIQGTTGIQKAYDVGFSNTSNALTVPVAITSIQGVGSYPMDNIVLTLGTPPSGAATEAIYIDLLVAYPSGQGLSSTPINDFGLQSFSVNNPSALASSAPTSYASMAIQALDYAHREVQLQYQTSQLTFTTSSGDTPENKFYLPERASSIVQVRVNGVPDASAILTGSNQRLFQLSAPPAANAVIAVDYTALRPLPQSGVQVTVYYQSRAPQTIRANLLGTSLSLVPRWISPSLYVITSGPGSQGTGYPYPYAYAQTGGVIKSTGSFAGEHELNGSVDISVADFSASTGFLKIPAYIPYVPDPNLVTFTRSLGDADIENRTFFANFAAGYVPNAFGTALSDARVHKVILPTLMELPQDGPVGRKGTLLLVNFVRWAAFDSENSIKVLGPLVNTTIASVFRVSGNLLNRRS